MATRAQLRTYLGERLRDSANHVTSAERDTAINRALETYNKHRPRRVILDIVGDGTQVYALGALYVPGLSIVLDVEYPLGDNPPTMLEKNDWRVYDDGDAWRIMFHRHTPSSTNTVRIELTTPHSIPDAGEATVLANDVYAFAALSAAVCMLELAARSLEGDDSTINADAVDWAQQPAEYRRLAEVLTDEYLDHVGAKGGAPGGQAMSSQRAAVGFRDLDRKMSTGVERLFHGSVST